MSATRRTLDILLVEDSPTDRLLTEQAFAEGELPCRIHAVGDGAEALRFIAREAPHEEAPRPHLVLLDLNLPKVDGRTVLRRLKADPATRDIPVVILTTSDAPDDIEAAYASFANSYIQKPAHFAEFADFVRTLERYWFQVVTIPEPRRRSSKPLAPPEATRERLLVVLVEPDPTNAVVLRELTTLAYADAAPTVHTIPRLVDAVEFLRSTLVDVVMTGLPGEQSVEMVRLLRSMQPQAAILVLADHDSEGGREAIRAGADDVLVKQDLSDRFIRSTVDHAQERRRLQRQLQDAARHRLLARLAGHVAHDFNNLLTIIRAEALALVDDGVDPAHLEGTLAATRRGERLTRQLLAQGRQQPLNPRPCDLAAFLEDQQRVIERLVGPGIELVVTVEPDLPHAVVDLQALPFMLYNVVTNAVDAMPTGGRMTLTARTHPQGVVLALADTGVGMTPEQRDQVLEPFFTTKSGATGSGLGLSSVQETMRAHGGEVLVTSELGKGTTVCLVFPQADGASQASHGEGTTAGSGTILVVDDEPTVLRAVARTLVRAGFTVHTAGTAQDAVAAHERGFDLLLTDLLLGPTDHGLKLADDLRDAGFSGPVLYMSGFAEEFRESGELVPGENFIQKPYDPTQLCTMIRRMLGASAPAPR
mgnify:CR=1 FL=1